MLVVYLLSQLLLATPTDIVRVHSAVNVKTSSVSGQSSYMLKFSRDKNAKEAVLFFPGVPGNLSSRNEDIAKAVTGHLGKDSYVVHYTGLGSNKGSFSFTKTLSNMEWAISEIQKGKYTSIQIVGHSWGGLLSLMAVSSQRALKCRQMILLSPVTTIPDANNLEIAVNAFHKGSPALFKGVTTDETGAELQRIGRSIPYEFLLSNLPSNVIVYQSRTDNEVPAAVTRSFIVLAKGQIKYHEVDTDHSFLVGREKWIDTIIRDLAND